MLKRVVLAALLAGCSTPREPGPPGPAEPRSAAVPKIEAESPEWEKIARELTRGLSPQEEVRLRSAEGHYELALAWFNRADFEKARLEAQKAVQEWPEHLAARKLLSEVGEIIIGGPARIPGIEEHDVRLARVTVEQQQLEITNHILQGNRYLAAGLYAGALREFESAEFKIRNMPYEVKSMIDLLPRVRALAARARSQSRN